MTDEQTIERFMNNAESVAAHATRVKDRAQLNAAVLNLISKEESIYCPRLTDVERDLGLPEESEALDYEQATACVEEVLGGIAETGSLICSSHRGKPVQASLLPSHHVALLSTENIYATLDDFFGSFGESPPTNVTVITGPSRTADIELTLTIGVHGPEQVCVIVF